MFAIQYLFIIIKLYIINKIPLAITRFGSFLYFNCFISYFHFIYIMITIFLFLSSYSLLFLSIISLFFFSLFSSIFYFLLLPLPHLLFVPFNNSFRAVTESCKEVGKNDMILLDSGGQYLDGTTGTRH